MSSCEGGGPWGGARGGLPRCSFSFVFHPSSCCRRICPKLRPGCFYECFLLIMVCCWPSKMSTACRREATFRKKTPVGFLNLLRINFDCSCVELEDLRSKKGGVQRPFSSPPKLYKARLGAKVASGPLLECPWAVFGSFWGVPVWSWMLL